MIGWLRGSVVHKSLESAVIQAGGVGYLVAMPLTDLATLQDDGRPIEIFVHTHVRAEAIKLFGFLEQGDKEVFERLIAVSGIGPKTALAILSGLDREALAEAVSQRDLTRLSTIPGIGKKTAERLCVELRDRLPVAAAAAAAADPLAAARTDLVSALENLGYKRQAAEQVALGLDDLARQGAGLEVLVREALSRLGGGGAG